MKPSNKMFDYLQGKLESVPLCDAERTLNGCKIIGVESVTENKTYATDILLYLERPDGSRFEFELSAMKWDKNLRDYDTANIFMSKAEFHTDHDRGSVVVK